MIDNKFSPKIIRNLIPELADNEQQLNDFIFFFKKVFSSEEIFVKFVSDSNKHYIRALILEFYDSFMNDF